MFSFGFKGKYFQTKKFSIIFKGKHFRLTDAQRMAVLTDGRWQLVFRTGVRHIPNCHLPSARFVSLSHEVRNLHDIGYVDYAIAVDIGSRFEGFIRSLA